ncbi:BMC domain-containing protein [Acerihabitans sp.]|uniref:BMC domain-containing protein n=1 Tax=Acerihabitans sp. TaxID=2811394 RepID=UPI002ED77DE3
MKTSLGLLEVAGLALAVKAADTMVKAANVALTGIERTNGSGWMLITITGDVAAVNSAITNGAALAHREHGWVADRVIARPADGLDGWFHGAADSAIKIRPTVDPLPDVSHGKDAVNEQDPPAVDVTGAPADEVATGEPARDVAAGVATDEPERDVAPEMTPAQSGLCNLCHDPACPRRKGDPRATCIHDGERG